MRFVRVCGLQEGVIGKGVAGSTYLSSTGTNPVVLELRLESKYYSSRSGASKIKNTFRGF